MKRTANILLHYLLLIFSFGKISAQQYNIKTLTTKDGLANSIVKNIFQDSKGYLWLATQGGISRYDGKKFRNFTSENGLPGSDITGINEDSNGNIWISTYGFGVVKYDGVKFTTFTTKDGLGSDIVHSIYRDKNFELWFSTFGGGLTLYTGTTFKKFTTKQGLNTNEVISITEDKKGSIWVGTRRGGLSFFDGTKFTRINYAPLDNLSIMSLFTDSRTNIWVGSARAGVHVFDGEKFSEINIPEIKEDLISSITEDNRGNIWIASEHGVVKYHNGSYIIFSQSQGLPTNTVNCPRQDYEGNLWIGTAAGVSLFKNEAFVTFNNLDGISDNEITSILKIADGSILAGTSKGGLNIVSNNKAEIIKSLPELIGSQVSALCQDKDGRIWVGRWQTEKNNLLQIEKTSGKYKIVKPLSHVIVKNVASIICTRNKNIWVADFGQGVFRISSDTVEHFNSKNKLPNDNILALYEDKKGNIWIGTLLGGVVRFDGKEFKTFTKENGMSDNSVWCITEDASGNLFFGTNERGIAIYNGKKFFTVSTAEDLSSKLVYGLAFDNANRLWAGTDRGLNRLEFDTDFKLTSLKYYGEKDGLKSEEINQNGLIYENGLLWIGTSNGLSRYDASYDYVNNVPPKLVLTNIRLFYDDVDWKKFSKNVDVRTNLPSEPVFSHQDNHLTFNFQALTTDKIKFLFKLEGLDNNWSPPTENNEATYPNIPPGNYIFKVKAVNSDGFWSNKEISFSFTIKPPFYQTWWFYVLVILFVTTSIFSFINWRTARLAKEKKVLEEKVTERTLELKGANANLSAAYTDIKDSINYAKRIQEAILPNENDIKRDLPEHFILFKPRDVVSGDFYWYNKKGDKLFIAAVDCTGHGVPGAFMSLIGNSLLNEVMNENTDGLPASILNMLRNKIISSLKQTGAENENKDGMDINMCSFDFVNKKLIFAGANNSLYIIRNRILNETKGDKQPIGIYSGPQKPFTNHSFDLQNGDCIYLFTDGYADQFGGERGKKFLYTRFKELFVSVGNLSMAEQRKEIEKKFENWKLHTSQVDDVLVIGIKVG